MSNKQVGRIYSHGHTAKQRVFMKKTGNKQLRKQHEKALQESLLDLDDQGELDDMGWECEDVAYLYKDDVSYRDADWDDEWEAEVYDPNDFIDDSKDHLMNWIVISMDDVGLTLGELLTKHNL